MNLYWEQVGLLTGRIKVRTEGNFVSNPIIKVANKDILFKDQQLISKEHHINLFIPLEDLSKCKFKIEMYSEITFERCYKEIHQKGWNIRFLVLIHYLNQHWNID